MGNGVGVLVLEEERKAAICTTLCPNMIGQT